MGLVPRRFVRQYGSNAAIFESSPLDLTPSVELGSAAIALRVVDNIVLKQSGTLRGYISVGSPLEFITYTNGDISFKPNGTGLVKFGVETTNAGSDRGKLIKLKTAAGTTVYVKTYDLV